MSQQHQIDQQAMYITQLEQDLNTARARTEEQRQMKVLARGQRDGISGSRYQEGVGRWLLRCFGPVVAADKQERTYRFLEEANELSQAAGLTEEEAHQLVAYTWSRPTGSLHQEVGGVMTTLAAFCFAHDLDMIQEGVDEYERVNTHEVMERIRVKQASKPHGSPLPATMEPRIIDWVAEQVLFEERFPVPEGIYWNAKTGCYLYETTDFIMRAVNQDKYWKGWREAVQARS